MNTQLIVAAEKEVIVGAACGGAVITQVNEPTRDDWRQSSTRFTVYTDGAARDVADEHYFTKHNIASLNFPCRSWRKVGGIASAIEAEYAKAAVEARFGIKVELKFSRKAGCSCGCSPGFVGKIVGTGEGFGKLSRRTIWVHEVLTDADKAEVIAAAAKYAKRLPAEIEEGNAQLAAEAAAKQVEEDKRKQERAARLERYAQQEARWAQQAADASLDSACL